MDKHLYYMFIIKNIHVINYKINSLSIKLVMLANFFLNLFEFIYLLIFDILLYIYHITDILYFFFYYRFFLLYIKKIFRSNSFT